MALVCYLLCYWYLHAVIWLSTILTKLLQEAGRCEPSAGASHFCPAMWNTYKHSFVNSIQSFCEWRLGLCLYIYFRRFLPSLSLVWFWQALPSTMFFLCVVSNVLKRLLKFFNCLRFHDCLLTCFVYLLFLGTLTPSFIIWLLLSL